MSSANDNTDNTIQASPRTRRLIRQAACAYVLIIVFASLHPFAGWRDPGLPFFFFLEAAWPRYWTVFDLLSNVFAYLPLGYLLTLSFWRESRLALAACLAIMIAALLSLSMEVIQAWLPSRVSSNIDLACDALGAALGALLAYWKGRSVLHTLATSLRRLLNTVEHTEFGLLLIALWLLTQLSPEIQLFGTGDIRHLLASIPVIPSVPYDPPSFFAIETTITACNMVAIGLITHTLLAHDRLKSPALLILFALALLIRTLSAVILVNPANALAWFTPGASLGILIGSVLLLPLLFLKHSSQQVLAGFMLMAGTVLVNVAPSNPYSMAALSAWQQGHFLNFNGLTRLIASLWPFIAMPYLLLMLRKSANTDMASNPRRTRS